LEFFATNKLYGWTLQKHINTMQLKFDANQEFQIQAIEAIANIFNGQPRINTQITSALGFPALPNQLDLSKKELLVNLQTVQEKNGIEQDEDIH
jgi:type III restriction enzyme